MQDAAASASVVATPCAVLQPSRMFVCNYCMNSVCVCAVSCDISRCDVLASWAYHTGNASHDMRFHIACLRGCCCSRQLGLSAAASMYRRPQLESHTHKCKVQRLLQEYLRHAAQEYLYSCSFMRLLFSHGPVVCAGRNEQLHNIPQTYIHTSSSLQALWTRNVIWVLNALFTHLCVNVSVCSLSF